MFFFLNPPASKYSLDSYRDVNVRPLGEFWYQDKPFLYVGSSSGNDGDFSWIYDVNEREKITIARKRGEMSFFGWVVDGVKVYFCSEWPPDYINSLPEYKFPTLERARHAGHKFQETIRLVFSFNEEWALFRMKTGSFSAIYIPDLQKCGINANDPEVSYGGRDS